MDTQSSLFTAPAVTTAAGVWTTTLFWALVFICLWAVFLVGMIQGGLTPLIGGQRRRTWALKAAMLCHHVVIGPAALVAIAEDPSLRELFSCFGCAGAASDMLRDTREGASTAAEWLMPVTMGYMIADLVLLPCWSLSKGSKVENILMIFHHTISLCVWPPTLLYNYCSKYVVILLAYELSSVFLTFMWLLSNAGLKNHVAYKVNGLLFTASFVVVRMFGALPQLVALWTESPWKDAVAENVAPGELMEWQIKATSTLVLPHMLNLFWGFKVVSGFIAILTKPKPAEDQEDNVTHDEGNRLASPLLNTAE